MVDPPLDCVVPSEPNANVIAMTPEGETVEFQYAWYSTAKGDACGGEKYVVILVEDARDFVAAWPLIATQHPLDDTARVFDTVLSVQTPQDVARESFIFASFRRNTEQFTLHGPKRGWAFTEPPPGGRSENLQGSLDLTGSRSPGDAGAAALGEFNAIWCEPVGGPYCE